MRFRMLSFGLGTALATLAIAPATYAQETLTPTGPILVSPTTMWEQYAVGDREPGVVPADANGTVFIAWVHSPTQSHRSTMNTLEHARLSMGSPPTLAGFGMRLVPNLAASALAVTRDPTGPLEIVGAYETDGVPVVIGATRPSDTGDLIRLEPHDGVALDANLDVSSISVPRRLFVGADRNRHIPIGLTVTAGNPLQDSLQSAEINVDAMLQPQGSLTLGPRGTIAPHCTVAERVGYVAGAGVFLDLQNGMFTAHPVSGMPSTGFGVPPTDTWPGFGNTADGDLAAVESVLAIPALFCVNGVTSSPVNCGALSMPVGEIDLAADDQYSHDAWFVAGSGRECISNTATGTPTLLVGNSHAPGTIATLDTSSLVRCSHPRISAVPGESLATEQHAVVVASCLSLDMVGTTQVSQVFAWVVSRPAVPDAGVDAGDDVVDATADDASADDASVPLDTGPSTNGTGPSFRGSGCTCRTTRSASREGAGAWAAGLFAMGWMLTRRRQRRSPR